MQNNLVSIITPSYKSKRFISQTIESVIAQTYENWEMLIVDDCSPDDSNEIIEKYCKKDSRIKLIKSEKNSGPAVARNRAIEEVKGRYIAFLDADDLWMPNKIEKQIRFMKNNDLAFTYSSYFVINEEDEQIASFTAPADITYHSMLKTCSVGCLTAVYDTKKLGKIYMKLIPKGQDYTLWLDIMKKIGKTYGIIEPLGYYRVRKISVSSNKWNAFKTQWKIYRKIEKIGFLKSLYYLANYSYYGFVKYKKEGVKSRKRVVQNGNVK